MNVTSESIERISAEIDFALKKMEEAATPQEMFFYFSASYGVINRIMNFECDPVLVFSHQVLSTVHAAFTKRMSMTETHMDVTPEMFEKLHSMLGEFVNALKQQDESKVFLALSKFSCLGYATTGNGFYLYKKGVLKF